MTGFLPLPSNVRECAQQGEGKGEQQQGQGQDAGLGGPLGCCPYLQLFKGA